MNLGDEIAAVLPRLRAAAESRMRSLVTIGEPGEWEYDPVTGKDKRTLTVLFQTKARLKARDLVTTRPTDAGAQTITVGSRELHIPASSPFVPIGAVVQVDAVDPATSDQTLVGLWLRVDGPVPGDQQTARRLQVSEYMPAQEVK